MTRKLNDWLRSYLDYTTGQESPDIFHLWCGISTIAATLERRVWLPRGFYTLYPNLYIVLVSGSAVARKSTAIGVASRVFKEASPEGVLVSQKITPEALIGILSEGFAKRKISSGYIIADELSVFLGDGNRDSSLIQMLTKLYDGSDFDYHTLSRGKEVCSNPCTNMIAGSAPDWLRTSLPAHAIGGGFTGRIVFVHHSGGGRRIPFPTLSQEAVKVRESLVEELRHIGTLAGSFKISGEAKEWFEDWYIDVYDPDKQDSALKPYFARKPDTLLKVSMVVSVSKRDDLVIEEEDVKVASELLGENEKFLPDMMRAIQVTQTGQDSDRVLGLVRKRGEVSHSEMLRQVSYFANAKMLGEILDGLVQSGLIKETMKEGRKYFQLGKR